MTTPFTAKVFGQSIVINTKKWATRFPDRPTNIDEAAHSRHNSTHIAGAVASMTEGDLSVESERASENALG
jgi:hypothetical protein